MSEMVSVEVSQLEQVLDAFTSSLRTKKEIAEVHEKQIIAIELLRRMINSNKHHCHECELRLWEWTRKGKLPDHVIIGSLELAGIEDGEYGTSEIDRVERVIDALQEKYVTGRESVRIPLLAFVGDLENQAIAKAEGNA